MPTPVTGLWAHVPLYSQGGVRQPHQPGGCLLGHGRDICHPAGTVVFLGSLAHVVVTGLLACAMDIIKETRRIIERLGGYLEGSPPPPRPVILGDCDYLLTIWA
jgi:hypothetical protein